MKNKCIDYCFNDEEYKYDFRKECCKECPENTKNNEINNYHCDLICNKQKPYELIDIQECVSNCTIYQLNKKLCIVNYVNNVINETVEEANTEIQSDIVNNIQQELTTEFNISCIEKDNDFVIEEKGFIYTITTTENKKNIMQGEIMLLIMKQINKIISLLLI